MAVGASGPTNTTPTTFVDAPDGVKYAYRRFGAAAGTPLLLLPRFRGDMDIWDPALLDTLAAVRPIVLFDNRGMSSTNGTTPSTIAEMARDVIAFCEAVGLGTVDLLGFSLGGFVAQEIALIRPHLVRRLILAATSPQGAPDLHGWRKDVADAVRRDEPGGGKLLYTFFKPTETNQTAGREYLGRFLARTVERDVSSTLQTRDAHYDAVCDWGSPDHSKLQRLSGIMQPTFVCNGDADAMIPPHFSHLMGGLIPDAIVKIYPDTGHGFLFQHHAEFAGDVNRFLDV
ncbi:alpha/beta hydrolase (plasmid) [Novosphingobium resinovorum]|uniref:alpha/beta fold hydrolase n=1 Tax=Novosphingobium TaxID=165696 RepID=UPI001B3C8667|nr:MULTISPECIES: alpha/beta hydrolase [Novosphingobium]MBF7015678.1 alpha/beta hydrolase [Novosphingobium sp. HR1a]WJM29671.1 alpha/beta hydrolase [Novosphingobium resinovorum]